MKNVQVDSNGQLHCWKCGALAFTEKRTFRAKATAITAGFATLGVAGAATVLGTKKKLRCQVCGEYNDVGSADPFKPVDTGTYVPRPVEPIEVKGTMGSVTFDGETITVKNLLKRKTVLRVENLRSILLEDFGGLWFGGFGAVPPHRTVSGFTDNPSAVTFTREKRPAFEALVAAVEAHRAKP